jgi:hypothetical protein
MGDTMVAHINPQEAQMLKAMGGSGTINPTTGLPEFIGGLGALNPFNKGSVVGKAIAQIPGVKETQNLATQVFQPVEKAVVQPVSKGLAQVDKAVGKIVPGGWGTLAQVAGSFMGLPTPVMVGMGALNGSGVMHPGRKFNMQGALMGGAMAYGMSELGDYFRAAGGAEALGKGAAEALPVSAVTTEMTAEEIARNAANETAKALANESGNVLKEVAQPNSITQNLLKGNVSDALSQVGTKVSEGATQLGKDIVNAPGNVVSGIKNYDYGQALNEYGTNASQTGSGIKNLLGAGDMTAKEAATLAAKSGVNPMMAAGATLYGGTSLAALDEQRKYLEESKKANAISQAEYDSKLAEINRQADIARKTVAAHPFNINPSRDVSIGDTYYGRTGANDTAYDKARDSNVRLYAQGGDVDGQLSLADYMMANSNQAKSPLKMASGGMPPRFLSGGGDGMSDSIDASIGGNQPAKLADGEFVVPADVVSHLGNGSSKAGAKRLYSMMDKVRVARTGNKKQGKQINPMKFMPA